MPLVPIPGSSTHFSLSIVANITLEYSILCVVFLMLLDSRECLGYSVVSGRVLEDCGEGLAYSLIIQQVTLFVVSFKKLHVQVNSHTRAHPHMYTHART